MKFNTFASVILALSIASERLVELVKSLWPWMNTPITTDEAAEAKRADNSARLGWHRSSRHRHTRARLPLLGIFSFRS